MRSECSHKTLVLECVTDMDEAQRERLCALTRVVAATRDTKVLAASDTTAANDVNYGIHLPFHDCDFVKGIDADKNDCIRMIPVSIGVERPARCDNCTKSTGSVCMCRVSLVHVLLSSCACSCTLHTGCLNHDSQTPCQWIACSYNAIIICSSGSEQRTINSHQCVCCKRVQVFTGLNAVDGRNYGLITSPDWHQELWSFELLQMVYFFVSDSVLLSYRCCRAPLTVS